MFRVRPNPDAMTIRANFQTNYLYRYLIMAAVCLGGSAWFAYDGFIGYPQKLPPAEAYDAIREIEDPDERNARWQELVQENDWPRATPAKTAEEIQADIRGQYAYMVIALIAGIPALLYFFFCRGTWVESTEQGLTTSWGQSVDFAKVTQLDKKKWTKKGIAKATYGDGEQTQVFVFDDFKYDREELGKILRRLESEIPRENIIGGPTEAELDAEKQAVLEAQEAEAEMQTGEE